MTLRGKSSIQLGTDDHGARFTWTPTSEYVDGEGVLTLDVWDVHGEPPHVVRLDSASALALAQELDNWLGR